MTEVQTFDAVLARAVGRHPDRRAIVFPDEQMRFRELDARIDAIAAGLIGMGVLPGSTVATLMPNCIDHVAAQFAGFRIGARVLPINTRFRRQELVHVLKDSGAGVVLTSMKGAEFSNLPQRLHEALGLHGPGRTAIDSAEFPDLHHLVVLGAGGYSDMQDEAALVAAGSSVDPNAVKEFRESVTGEMPAIMLYTSGTTSAPKGCPLRNDQMVSVGLQVGERLGATDGDVLWDALPLFHASSLLPMLAVWSVDGTFVSQATPEPQLSLEMIERERPNLLWPAFTQIWQSILADKRFDPVFLTAARAVLCIGPLETVELLQSRHPRAAILSCYGITEGSGLPAMARWDDEPAVRLGTGGFPMDGIEARVVDPFTRSLQPADTVGALHIRGENVFGGYWNAGLDVASFDADGWFDTGDLATRDAAGRVTYQGRLKDMLKVGGENVAAIEIEALISTHPSVKIVAVIGVPDDKLGEVPAAFVELHDGAVCEAEELKSFCAERVASFKVPRHVRFLTEWPMSATKIRKVDLREQFAMHR